MCKQIFFPFIMVQQFTLQKFSYWDNLLEKLTQYKIPLWKYNFTYKYNILMNITHYFYH